MLDSRTKVAYTTHIVPPQVLHAATPLQAPPQIGDLVVAEVLQIGNHKRIEDIHGAQMGLFEGDLIAGAWGNRYATDQYEGYVPQEVVDTCDLLSAGGVCGQLASAHSSMPTPTRLRVVGAVSDREGQIVNLHTWGLQSRPAMHQVPIIMVVGASMNAGKTTTVGTLVRSLRRAGQSVTAIKATGTASSKDGRYFQSCGADRMLTFIDAGYPSTYMLDHAALFDAYMSLVAHAQADRPDAIVVEIADGIFQRETKMLLDDPRFRETIDHLFFATGDSLSAAYGVRTLQDYGLPLRGISGAITQSPLAMQEAEAASEMECFSIERLMSDDLLGLLQPTLNQRAMLMAA